MAQAHTPGPWRLGKNRDDVVADTNAGHQQDSGSMDFYGGHLVAESIATNANRLLIAAAPQLLEALEGLLQHIGWPGGSAHDSEWVTEPIHIDEINAALAAVRAARGE